MKKILMICEAFGGGVFTYVTQLCNDMVDHFDVYLAYSLRPLTPKDYQDFLDSRVHLIRVQSWENKSVTDIWNDLKVISELRNIAKQVKPDIIHLHSSIAGALGRIAFNGKNSILVYTPHGYDFISNGKNKFTELAEKILGRRKCITLTCCESEDKVAKKLCRKTAYIETGVNLKDLSESLDTIPIEKNETFTVYTLGRICTAKQPDLVNRIAQLVPQAQFLWIGDGEIELRNHLTAPNIKVTGWKPRKEALALAKSANAFILTSLGEAISMALLENMYMGKLCLVSNAVGNKSVIHDGINGYLCNTAEEYAIRIQEAMTSFPTSLTECACYDVLNVYNTEVMKEKFVKFYMQLCADQ